MLCYTGPTAWRDSAPEAHGSVDVCFGALTVITFVIYGEIPFGLVPNLVLATFGCVGLLTMLVANSASAPKSARAEIRLASRRGRKA